MARAAVVILAGTDSHADSGRLVNGLETAREFAETESDEVELIFDGAGTQWVPELADPEHDNHDLYRAVADDAVACEYCSAAFDVEDEVADAGVPTRDDHDGHPSLRSLVADDYEVMTF